MRVTRIAVVCFSLAVVACSTKARDCDVAIETLQGGSSLNWDRIPKDAAERDKTNGLLESRAAAWDGVKGNVKNQEILGKGNAVARAQRGHAKLLASIDFGSLAKPSEEKPPEAKPSGPKSAGADSDLERKQALAEAAAAAADSLLGPQLPADTRNQLAASSKELERQRRALVDECTPD